ASDLSRSKRRDSSHALVWSRKRNLPPPRAGEGWGGAAQHQRRLARIFAAAVVLPDHRRERGGHIRERFGVFGFSCVLWVLCGDETPCLTGVAAFPGPPPPPPPPPRG